MHEGLHRNEGKCTAAPSSFPVATDFYAREVSGLPAEIRRQVRNPLAWAALSRLM